MKTKLITITLVSLVAVLTLVPLFLLNQASAQMPPSPGGLGLPLSSITISGCTTITSPGYYVLDRDIVDADVEQLQPVSPVPTLPGEKQSSACIFIRSSNVIFDGKGYTIDGTDVVGTYGVYVYDPSTNLTNVTVKNVVVTDWYNGIYYRNIADGNIENNTANSNYYFGIRLDSSNYNTLTNNTANSNYFTGINLYSSNNNTLTNNTANLTDYMNGISLFSSNYNTLTNNTANSNYSGIQFYSSNSNTLTNNTANSNGHGIYLEYSSNNTLTNNTENSNYVGINLYSSSNNTLTNNNANSSYYYGIVLVGSSSNILINNTISANNYGIWIYSSSNTLTNNTISANNYGIWIHSLSESSSENTIYNNYFNNTNNFLFEGTIYANYWNTTKTAGINIIGGPYLGGNFWANPNGTGFSQTCEDTDNDGICDDPYSLNTSNVDYLSLTFPPPGNQPPTCVIKLQKDGVEINEINTGEFFDIYIGDSTDDTGIKEVRFSSDDSQNGVPEGEWTQWYNWSTSSEDWNAETKIKRWSFTSGGDKEVWVEVKDIGGQTSQCSANISVVPGLPQKSPPILLVHGYQFGCFNPNDIWQEMIKTLTGIEIEFINTGLLLTTPDCGTEEIKVVKQTESVQQVGKMDERGISIIRVEGNGLVIYTSNYSHNTLKPTFNDIRDYAKNLANEIQLVKNLEGVNKVDIVAHSTGGLVARSYIEVNDLKNLQDNYNYGEFTYNNDVRKLIMLGTPNNGVELAVIGVLLPATKEYQYIKKCSEEYAICALDCLFAPEKEREECIDKCIEKCTECLGDIEELKRRLVEDYSYFSIAQLMPEEYNRFLKILNTPNVINFETEYSAIAGNYCDIAGVACLRELLFPVGDGRVSVESVVKLNEIPEERRYIYPLKHSELPNATLSTLGVEKILRGLKPAGSFNFSRLYSPGELRVYDSQGNVTGLINGEAKEEIPNSMYDTENEAVIIFDPFDSYRYEVIGTETGTYGLEITSVENGEVISFTATDIPTMAGQNHQYIIDWQALSQGEKGATLLIDADGDGIFEKTVSADNNLTYDEFILQTETTIDFDPDTLNLNSKGEPITIYIELPEGYAVSQIDIPSIILNGSVPALAKPTEIGDYDKNGTPDLIVKFDRFNVQTILNLGNEVPVTITGKVFHNGNYIDFKGSDMIRVVDPGGSKK